MQDNRLYTSQFLLLAFMSTSAFKVIMLPAYLCSVAGNMAWVVMLIMSVIELGFLAIIYRVAKLGGVCGSGCAKWLQKVVGISVVISSTAKLGVLGGEFCSYVSTQVFDHVSWLYVALATIPIVAYISSKGLNALGRASQILFWVIALTVVFNIFFARLEGDKYNLFPLVDWSNSLRAIDKHLVWFSDFTPLIFVSLVGGAKRNKLVNAFTILLVALFPTLIVGVLVFAYGNGGVWIDNAIGRLTEFHLLATIMGKADLLTIVSWFIMAIVKLALIFYAIVQGIALVIGRRKFTNVVVSVLAIVLIVFGMSSLTKYYAFATSWIRYVVAVIEYGLPIVVSIFIKGGKNEEKGVVDSNLCRNIDSI